MRVSLGDDAHRPGGRTAHGLRHEPERAFAYRAVPILTKHSDRGHRLRCAHDDKRRTGLQTERRVALQCIAGLALRTGDQGLPMM